MIRLLLPVLLTLLLSACLTLPKTNGAKLPEPSEDSALSLFIEGIDHFEPGHRTEAFLKLEQQFSDSAWNRRAKVLANLAGSTRLLEKKIQRQQTVLNAHKKNNELALKKLSQENNLLQEQVKVLKSLIIDLELHQP